MIITKESIQRYIDENIDEWVNQVLLDDVKRYCLAANLPKRFIDHIRVFHDTDGTFRLENSWKRTTKYGTALLAVYFEHGTRDHWIQPKYAQVLMWGHPGHAAEGGQKRGYGHAIYFQRHATKKDQKLFSKGHYVTGLPKTLAMHKGFEAGKKRLQQHISYMVRQHFSNETGRLA